MVNLVSLRGVVFAYYLGNGSREGNGGAPGHQLVTRWVQAVTCCRRRICDVRDPPGGHNPGGRGGAMVGATTDLVY